MPFEYFSRLAPGEQAIYLLSAGVGAVRLPRASEMQPLAAAIEDALARADRRAVEAAAARLCSGITEALGVAPVRVTVLEVRPRSAYGELHGLYTRPPRRRAVIEVWMRTARHARVVAFRTFLRTLLHEIVHHLDFDLLRLPLSFHTEGFFKRESSLFHQLVPGTRTGRRPARPASPDQAAAADRIISSSRPSAVSSASTPGPKEKRT